MFTFGDDTECLVEEGGGRENGGVLAEDSVVCGFSTAQGGVVHAREIVEYQGSCVDHLDRARRVEGCRHRRSEIGCNLDRQQWADPFAAGKQAVAHGPMEPFRMGVFRWNELSETVFNLLAQVLRLHLRPGHLPEGRGL